MTLMVRRPIGFHDPTYEIEADRMPTYAQLSRAINQIVTERDGEWCGTPMPLPGLSLILEDRHPHAARMKELQRIVDEDVTAPDAPDASAERVRFINAWYSFARCGTVFVVRDAENRVQWFLQPDKPARNALTFGPMETLDAWDLEVELTAIDRLASLLSERMFKSYVLTGGFLETSKRSRLTYWFRRCRPTVVLTFKGGRHEYFWSAAKDTETRILCALCLHPLGYYAKSFMGAMVPTDDVIAHLLLLRGDEALFWRRANQHAAHVAEAGI